MTVESLRTRKPWLAGLLQVITPGLGNLYSGRPQRALGVFLLLRLASFGSIIIFLTLSGWFGFVLFFLIGLSLTIFVIIDGVRSARESDPHYTLRPYNRWYVYILVVVTIAIFDGLFVDSFIRSRVFQAMQSASPSMEPTVLLGDHVVINKTAYLFSEPKRGDIVTFEPREFETTYLKRIVALPGETISIRDGVVFIDGQKLAEPYVSLAVPGEETTFTVSFKSTVVPPDSYFVLGDSRERSNDSRFFGPIPRESVQGRATTIYFSMDPETRKIRWNRIGLVPK